MESRINPRFLAQACGIGSSDGRLRESLLVGKIQEFCFGPVILET